MNNNGILKKFASKLIVILTLIGILAFTCFGLTACGNETGSSNISDPNYSYSEEDDGVIKNNSFAYGTVDLQAKDYPFASPLGWTKASDNTAKTSNVNSGVVSTDVENWKTFAEKLYDDIDYRNFLINKGVYTLDNVKAAIKASDEHKDNADYSPTAAEIKNYVVENYIIPLNPASHDNDGHVYMLNNYLTEKEYGLGTAQKISTSTSIKVEKNTYAKVSVWIKTQNISGINSNGDFGANIRITSSLKSNSQADFRISNIIANEWTNYTIYVKGDSYYPCSFTLSLGLGYGSGNVNDARFYTEGTVYFDDITYEAVDSVSGVNFDGTYTLQFGETKAHEEKTGKTFLYDMTFTTPNDFFTAQNFATDFSNSNESTRHYYYTESNIEGLNGKESSKTLVADSNVSLDGSNAKKLTLDLNKASYTIKLDNNGQNFKLNGNEYIFLTFELENQLTGFGAKTISFDIFDIYNGNVKKRTAVATIDPTTQLETYTLLIRNSFENQEREFYVNVVVGPNDISSIKYDSDFATGKVEISNLRTRKGTTPDTEDTYYDYYRFYQNSAITNFALYAGLATDTGDTSSEHYEHSLTPAPAQINAIVTEPTIVNGYYGITPDHAYIDSNNDKNLEINNRTGKTGQNGSYAGLINSKYIDNYNYINGIKTALNYTDEKQIQPLMIYNKTADHYGFVGDSYTISTNTYASVSVKLRVTDGATAYIYLVNTSNPEKEVMTFRNFTVNTSLGKVEKGTEIDGSKLTFELPVTTGMMKSDGWLTVNFYIATGAESKDFRLEIWNGSRDNVQEKASAGFVFVSEVNMTLSEAFTEPMRLENAFSIAGNPLFDQFITSYEKNNGALYAYQQELTELEKQFNKEHEHAAVSYAPTFVWAKNAVSVYAIYNTIEAVEIDPYQNHVHDDETTGGCQTEVNPSTFWLQFSSILLGVILVLAILALFVKNYRRRHSGAKEAKSHYKVVSRVKAAKTAEKISKKANKQEELEEDYEASIREVEEEPTEEIEEESSYIYGEVQDFGENTESTESETQAEETETTEE